MDMNQLWESTCSLLKNRVSTVAYNYLIAGNLFPVEVTEDRLILSIAMEQLKPSVVTYAETIRECVQAATGRNLKVEIRTKAELAQAETPAPAAEDSSVALNDRYTFDSFVVGGGNRFAHAAAIAVADAPGKVYNPLFIYGGSGLGKTHLMHAIGHYVHEQHPQLRLMYITSEAFTNELISAIQQGSNNEFRARFRTVDILMVDDIQFIAGRDSTQEEFFNTFNDLHNAGKQIVLTSDRPPQEIARLEERRRSRFAWGLICDVQRPDLDTRIAILRSKARRESMNVPDEVLELIAVHVDSNIRELEGKLIRLKAYAGMMNQPYTESLCREALRDVFENPHSHVITPELILRVVAQFYSLGEEDLTGASRRRDVALPRQIAMYLTRELTTLSLPQIGSFFGNRDHSTVLHACTQIAQGSKTNSTLLSQINDLRQLIRADA